MRLPNYVPKMVITGTNNTKFLGLQPDKNISWRNHGQEYIHKLTLCRSN
jgi:hypothetical protein